MATTANEVQNELEEYIDSHSDPRTGVANVLSELHEVLAAKAEHLRTNWQDEESAKLWEYWGKVVARAERDL